MDTTGLEIAGCPTGHVQHLWFQLEPFFEKAMFFSADEYSMPDLYNALIENKMQLWTAYDNKELIGVVITEFIKYPNYFVCHPILVSGVVFDRWSEIVPTIEEWALQIGAQKMRTYARPGWRKRAKEFGYKMQYCIYQKDLTKREGLQ